MDETYVRKYLKEKKMVVFNRMRKSIKFKRITKFLVTTTVQNVDILIYMILSAMSECV